MAKIKGTEFDDYLVSSVAIYPEQIQEEFCRAPADIAYFGEQTANATRAHRLAELARREGEATLQMEHRARLNSLGKVTEAAVEAAVRTDPRWHDLQVAEIEAEAEMLAARHRYTAVLAKRDMVQSLGALMRSERERVPAAVVQTGPRDW